MANINTDGMISAAETFETAYNHLIEGLIDDTKVNILKFIIVVVNRYRPYSTATEEGLLKMIELVFSNEEYRDFIFSLHFHFFSRWGNSDEEVDGLIRNISRGISLASNVNLNAIPKVINERLVNSEDSLKILQNNKWLVIILMLQLFVKLDTDNGHGKK